MFTGLVSAVGTVESAEDVSPTLRRFCIAAPYEAASIAIGASIACAGICLTAVAVEPASEGCLFTVETAAETLARTLAGTWTVGTRLNLERSLRIGDELGGHLVTGHVDGIADLVAVEPLPPVPDQPWAATAKFVLRAPVGLARFVAAKGSVCLDGTSLTVNEVEGDRFSVLLIPHSLAVTTWGERKARDRIHIEVDLLARYAARLAEASAQGY